MNFEKRYEIFERLREKSPKPKTELIYSSNFELLISVILSAQATDISVNKATKNLFNFASTPDKIFKLGYKGLVKYIKSIGLYKTKAKNIIETCKILISIYDGKVPNSKKDLLSLPGVGNKTANVVLNVAFGFPTIAVDTHIFRVANRTGIAKGKNVEIVEKKLMKLIPPEFKLYSHHWLILLGRYTCMARSPKCFDCLISDLCEYKNKVNL
tara:strand:- start:57 stop:692 length:636 start_codon:yes stop_codon:yes gene_type:complete